MKAFGGYFVVINEDLHEEFDGFKKKVYMCVDSKFPATSHLVLIRQ